MVKEPRARRTLVALTLFAVAAFAAACELILPIDDNIPPLVEAGVEAATDSGPPPPPADVCPIGVHPPPKPTADDGTESRSYVLAVSNIDVTQPPSFGFDVDGVCSCDTRDHTKHDGGPACLPSSSSVAVSSCDTDGGVDNAFAVQVSRVGLVAQQIAARLNAQLLCGNGGIVITLEGYNGLANDTDVFLRVVPSFGLLEAHLDGGDPDASNLGDGGGFTLLVDGGTPEAGPVNCGFWVGSPIPPLFNGSDRWSTPPGTSSESGNVYSLIAVPLHAYVSNWVLVVDASKLLPDAGIDLPLTANVAMPVRTPIFTMPIVPLDENMAPLGPATKTPATFIRVDHALVGGRVDREALLRSFATITFAPGGKSVACQGGLVWTNGIQLGICGGGDLTDESVTDFGDPLQSCTALSVGLGFTAFPAQVGPPYDNDAAVPLSVCDASTYTCP